MNKKISIILPCYNEGKNIYKNALILSKILKKCFKKKHLELIFVNDGSPDNTHTELEEVIRKIPFSRMVSYEENTGKGYALQRGVMKAKGDIIALYDGDLDIKPQCLIEYIHFLQEHADYDMVIGSKKINGSQKDVSLKRKILSNVNMQINAILFSLPIQDTQVGLKVFRKNIQKIFIKKVSTYGYAFDVDLLYHVHKAGHKIIELPVILSINNENSSVTPLSMMLFLRDIFLLYKKTQHTIKKKKITLITRWKIAGIRCIIFPVEWALQGALFFMKIFKR